METTTLIIVLVAIVCSSIAVGAGYWFWTEEEKKKKVSTTNKTVGTVITPAQTESTPREVRMNPIDIPRASYNCDPKPNIEWSPEQKKWCRTRASYNCDGLLNIAQTPEQKKWCNENPKRYPDHWGPPPTFSTNDLRQLPGGYGLGSSTLQQWIEKKMAEDGNTPYPFTTQSTIKKNTISKNELSSHDDRSSCWVGYKGSVYDITSWLFKHPGGISSIESYCGTCEEFTKAFNDKHGTTKESVLKKEGKIVGNYEC
jgi:cytochrome b involved in lipid metabolism